MIALRSLISWFRTWRSESAPLQFAEQAFRRASAAIPHHVGTVAEDEQSYIVQILYDSISCPMASFWGISKAELTAREMHASELQRFFLHLAPLAADDDLRSLS